jgi:hypothetical protein
MLEMPVSRPWTATEQIGVTRHVIAPNLLANRNQLDVLLLGRDFGIHKGLGVNGNHTASVLQRAGVRAQDMLVAQDKLPGKLFETLEKTQPRAAVLMAFFLDTKTFASVVEAFPDTHFYVKCHSNPQFLAAENSGWQRLLQVADVAARLPNVSIGCASEDMLRALQALGVKSVLLPNVYDFDASEHVRDIEKFDDGALHVGLFGALRPFKNAVGQTCALVMAARASRRPLVLHVNGTRVEMSPTNDLVNMQEICRRACVRLEVHGWLDYAEFVALAARMHLALQVSFTETFNYVAADCVAAGTPVVGSTAIRFLPTAWKVNPDDSEAIATAILDAPTWDVAAGQRALADWNRWAAAKLLQELTRPTLRTQAGTKRKRVPTITTTTRRGTQTTSTEGMTRTLSANLGIGESPYGG